MNFIALLLKYLLIIILVLIVIFQFKFIYIAIDYKVFHNDKVACDNYRNYGFKKMIKEEFNFYKRNIFFRKFMTTENIDTVITYSNKIDSMYISYSLLKE